MKIQEIIVLSKKGLKEPIEYINSLEDKEIYITNKIKEPYIYVLFYTKYNTNDFVNTVKYQYTDVEFRQVESFGKYIFEDIEIIENDKKNVYLIKTEDIDNYEIKDFKVTNFENYLVLEGTK